jgi:dihydropyrimidine dehydrogenase (NAD+) subunit PreT
MILSKVRTDDYLTEAVPGFTHRTAMEEAARCLLCHDAPCSEGCPAGTDPGRFIRSIRFRNPKGAAEIIRENNVLGGTCARVCPFDRLCEEACSRCGIDRPIEIGKLQRYAIEQERAFKMKILKAPEVRKKQNVACVGAGPASIACAAELAKEGYRVTIFEKNAKAGGVLTYGITAARLPQKVVDHDLSSVKGLGVRFEYNNQIGKKIAIKDLLTKKGYSAVFIGVGLWAARKPDIPGNDLRGVLSAVDFLKAAREKNGFEKVKGKNVVVIGGGDVAMDCATTAKLSGAANVAIWYRRTIAEAPANMDEILYATELGVTITQNFAPKKIHGKTKVELIEFKGRDGKSVAKVEADFVIFAIGQSPEDMKKVSSGFVLNEKGGIVTEEGSSSTSINGVFAAGDIVSGGYSVVEAVRDGKAAAADIIEYLEREVK